MLRAAPTPPPSYLTPPDGQPSRGEGAGPRCTALGPWKDREGPAQLPAYTENTSAELSSTDLTRSGGSHRMSELSVNDHLEGILSDFEGMWAVI